MSNTIQIDDKKYEISYYRPFKSYNKTIEVGIIDLGTQFYATHEKSPTFCVEAPSYSLMASRIEELLSIYSAYKKKEEDLAKVKQVNE